MTSQARQNFSEESEAGINQQINTELYISYVYQSMSFYYDRDDVALAGFSKFFKELSDKSYDNAQKFMTYQNKRGGRVHFEDVKKPPQDEWGTGLKGMEVALSLEKSCNQGLIDLHTVADKVSDAQFADFLEGEFMSGMVERVKKISDHVTNLRRVGSGLGEYQFDKETLSGE